MKKFLSIIAIAFAFCLFNNPACAEEADKSVTIKRPDGTEIKTTGDMKVKVRKNGNIKIGDKRVRNKETSTNDEKAQTK